LAQSPAGVWRKAGVEAGVWRKPRQPESPPPNVASSSTGGNPAKRRRPRQPESPPPNVASSSTGGNPVNLEPVVLNLDGADGDGAGYDSEFTVLSSDESGASIFGLRSALHEVEEDDELSDSSSQGDGEMAVPSHHGAARVGRTVAEKVRVSKWRTDNFLLDSLDFAYVFTDFEEAYSQAGRAVAMSWSKAATLAEPEMVTDMTRVSAVEATATKIRKVDEQKKTQAIKRRKLTDASSLRQPGEGAEVEEEEEDKVRFIEPLAQLMMDCEVGRTENASATDEEFMSSLRRKATRVVKAAGIPTLHIAITTADELRKYLESRETHMGVNKVEPIVLEEFLWQSRARVRAVNAICWMCKNLRLGWPIDSVERPDTKKASPIVVERKQAPVAQPVMLKALETP